MNYNKFSKQIMITKPDGSLLTMNRYLKSRTDKQIRDDIRDVMVRYDSAINNVQGRKLKTILVTLLSGIADTSKPIPVKE